MAGKSTISITFKLNSEGKGFKDLAKDAEGLKKVITSTVTEAQQLNGRVINFAAMATGINAARDSLVQLHAIMKNLGDAYAVQEGAEKRLDTVMRQRMQATAADVQSIKDLTSAQQALGVIGDEVQLSGAQQLATFLHERKSLETLIPAMNNLIAQQKGLTATTQDAVNVGNMMGKVFTGQLGALTRVGVTFTEAEGKVLKYGNEEEKAAMLAQVITNNVGNMNAEFAKTDSGKLQQTVNVLGDYKEQLGGIVKGVLPFLTIASQASIAMGGVVTLVGGLKTLKGVLTITSIKTKAVAAGMGLLGLKATRSTAVVRVFSGALHNAALRATALKIALRGLMITTGIGAAIVAVTAIIDALANSSDEAADKQRRLADEMATAKKEMRDISKVTADNSQKEVAALDRLYKVASDESAARGKRTEAMREMIRQYPRYFSGIDTEKINVAALTTQYNLLRESIIKVARARAAEAKIEANESRRIEIGEEQQGLLSQKNDLKQIYDKAKAEKIKAEKERNKFIANYTGDKSNRTFALKLKPYADKLNAATKKETESLRKYNEVVEQRNKLAHEDYELRQANSFLSGIASDVPDAPVNAPVVGGSTGGGDSTPVLNNNAQTLKEIEGNVAYYNKMLENATAAEAVGINKSKKVWEDKAEAIRNAGKALGSTAPVYRENAATLDEINENIDFYSSKLQTATATEAAEINKSKKAWEDKAEAIRNAGLLTTPVYNKEAATLKDIDGNVSVLTAQLQTATIQEAALINKQIEYWQKKGETIRNVGKITEKANNDATASFANTWGGIKQIGGGVESLTEAVKGNANTWQTLCGIIDGFLSIYNGITAIIGIINTLTQATDAQTAAETAKAAATATTATTDTAATGVEVANSAIKATASGVEASADMTAATAKVFKAHSWIPFVGVAMAAAMVATMIATLSKAKGSVPKFADGGVAFGPTLGLFGEYPGASNNPEVVAPLDKLRGMLTPAGSGELARVEFEIKGRTLVGILNKENAINKRG